MKDTLEFDNKIVYMTVNPNGSVVSSGTLKNAVGQRTKDIIMRHFTQPWASHFGTVGPIGYMYFRCDGTAALGTGGVWTLADNSTCYATRYSNSTYVSQIAFNATKTATAQITCKGVTLNDITMSGSDDVGSRARYWSTNTNITIGSGGFIIIRWLLSL